MIVIDVGCCNYGGAQSVPYLLRRFRPERLYAFDPRKDEELYRSKRVRRFHAAAWTFNGTVGIHWDGNETRISDQDPNWPQVTCIDLAEFIEPHEGVVLKLDCEGSEYGLLQHLVERGCDEKLSLLLVEWHGDERVEVRCPVEEWVL